MATVVPVRDKNQSAATAASGDAETRPAVGVRSGATRSPAVNNFTIPIERSTIAKGKKGWSVRLCCCMQPRNFFDKLHPTDLDRLIDLRRRIHIRFDPSKPEHIKMLVRLWKHAYPETADLITPIHPCWKYLGFQSDNPVADLRGSGVFVLHAMLYFSSTHLELFKDIAETGRAYPWASACVNIMHILKFHLGLADDNENAPGFVHFHAKPKVVKHFVQLYIAYEAVLEKVFCACVRLVDLLWSGLLRSPVQHRQRRRSSLVRQAESLVAVDMAARQDGPASMATRQDLIGSMFSGAERHLDDGIEGKMPYRNLLTSDVTNALIDFPKVILVVRDRLESALASVNPDKCVWSEFETSLLQGAESVRFHRTPV
jgi:hypothetical protein